MRTRASIKSQIRKHSPVKHNVVIKDEDKPLEHYTEIIKGIWIGNYRGAKDKAFFEKHKIKAVLNCTTDLPSSFCSNKGIEYMRVPIEDSLKEKDYRKMVDYFPVIVEFIHKHHVLEKHNILVHCWAGRQRSAISVAAYLVKYYKLTPNEAIKFIVQKRQEAFHFHKSINFDWSLDTYYKQLTRCKG